MNQKSTLPHPNLIQISAALISLALLAGLGTGCSPTPPPPIGVSNDQLDLSIGELPEGWVVKTNQGPDLIVVPSDPERLGTVEFIVGPEETGINLVSALEDHRKDIEGRPEGAYSGAQELKGPMGTAFYSRGRFTDSGVTTEETRILSLHPRSSRMVQMVYRYPAGDDSSTRVRDLIELFGEVG